MTFSLETERQRYSKELATYTSIQFSASHASLAQNIVADSKLPVAHAISSGTQRASAGGMLH